MVVLVLFVYIPFFLSVRSRTFFSSTVSACADRRVIVCMYIYLIQYSSDVLTPYLPISSGKNMTHGNTSLWLVVVQHMQ